MNIEAAFYWLHKTLSDPWVIIGLFGQLFFTMRFIVQWVHSERLKKSVVPVAFWFFSLGGGATLFAYALYKHDLVFSLGQGVGLLIYVRNLMLIFGGNREEKDPNAHDKLAVRILLPEVVTRLKHTDKPLHVNKNLQENF